MATTNTALQLPFQLAKQLGQGALPLHRVRLSTDGKTTAVPTWTDYSSKARAYDTNRGRENEWSEFDNGNATVELNDSDRTFDPIVNAAIKPMNRVWIVEEYAGETHDLFKGYAESWQHEYDRSAKTAVATVAVADELKVLNLDHLPTTSPPRDTYGDVVEFDQPFGYWPLDDPSGSFTETAKIGSQNMDAWAGGGMTAISPGAIVGDPNSVALRLNVGDQMAATPETPLAAPGDASGLSAFAVDVWFRFSSFPGVASSMFHGALVASGAAQWTLDVNTVGVPTFTVNNAAGTLISATGGAIALNRWHHICGALESGSVKLYINGALVASASFGGSTVRTGFFANTATMVLTNVGGAGSRDWDELAFYRYGLPASRVLAHYQAGAQRGFPSQTPAERVQNILDLTGDQSPRRFVSWTGESLQQRYMRGQAPLEEIRAAEGAGIDLSTTPDSIDAAFFVAADGELNFLGPAHRTISPYDTVQATFGDGGGSELPFEAFTYDYSETFLRNDYTVTREGGETQEASDTSSINQYGPRPESKTNLILLDDIDALAFAVALLAKYKDPMYRITSIRPKMALPDVAYAVYRLELMDRIRVLVTPPGGGARFDQTLFVQKISHSYKANPAGPPICTLAVSPL